MKKNNSGANERTYHMNKEKMVQILEKIISYDTIIIMRHVRPDGDAVGSTKGFQKVLRDSFPQKNIYVINHDYSDKFSFMNDNDEDVAKDVYENALGIVLDTATHDRISNKKFDKCRELVKIDHHIVTEEYGNLSWVEENASSTCEMIASFCLEFWNVLRLTKEAAEMLYAGIITDTGHLKFECVKGNTLRTAAALLDCGVDTETLFSFIDLEEPNVYEFKGYIYSNLRFTEHGVAYVYVDKAMQDKFGLSREEASLSVTFLSGIKGSIIWLAFIDNDDGETIRVRLRSRFTTINKLAEKYGGGGHDRASGATVRSAEEMNRLLKDADEQIFSDKETHKNWI